MSETRPNTAPARPWTRRGMLRRGAAAAALGSGLLGGPPARAEAGALRIAKQPGLSYLPAVVAEKLGLVERQARAAGLPLTVSWTRLTSGGASNDALLSGSVDMVISGGPNMLIVWGKTNGRVKGVVATGALPMKLVTDNPAVRTLADFTAADRIALPTVRVGTQPLVLQIAVERQFGPEALDRYNAMTIAMGHPDAMIALMNRSSTVTAHFSQPPFQDQELAIPGVHAVLDSVDVMGGPITNGCVYATTAFHDANPKVIGAFVAAIQEAIAFIAADRRAAAEIYLDVNKEKISVDDLTAVISRPEMVFSAAPQNLLPAAQFFSRAGYIRQKPTSWKEFFFEGVHDLPGG